MTISPASKQQARSDSRTRVYQPLSFLLHIALGLDRLLELSNGLRRRDSDLDLELRWAFHITDLSAASILPHAATDGTQTRHRDTREGI
jgi:hypothetical protein